MLIENAIAPLLGKLPSCPEPDVARAYLFALIEFCSKTKGMSAWVTTSTEDMKTPNLGLDQQVIDIIDATLDGKDLSIVMMNDRRVLTATDENPVLTWQNVNVPMVIPDPPEILEVQLLLAYAPGPTATTVEDTIYVRYQEALENGTLARLYAAPDAAWSKPALVAFHKGEFEKSIEEAKATFSKNVNASATKLRTTKGAL